MKIRLSLLLALLLLLPCFSLPTSALSLSAESAILMEADSGRVLYQKNAFVRRPMASTTKIMTALVAIEAGGLDRPVTVAKEAIGVEGSSIYLMPKETLSLRELLYALMLQSANDAATAIAVEIGGSVSGFAELMNQKAAELQLSATHFENPHGLDHEDHYTTAYDLAKLTAYALKNEIFRDMVSTLKKTIPRSDGGVRVLVNHNKLLRLYDGAIGVKTGFTKKSGRCLVGAAERDGLRLISVTLSAGDDWNDHQKLFDYGFERYTAVTLGALSLPLPLAGGTSDYIMTSPSQSVKVMLPRSHGEITYRVEAVRPLVAPLRAGDPVGTVIWSCDGKDIGSSPLVADTAAESPQRPFSFLDWLLSLFRR